MRPIDRLSERRVQIAQSGVSFTEEHLLYLQSVLQAKLRPNVNWTPQEVGYAAAAQDVLDIVSTNIRNEVDPRACRML